MSKQKIQFAYLDSGIGGLPYLKYLKNASPTATCMYVADTKNFPYGQKTREQVISCATECVRKIIFCYEPNVIVVACNTISVAALDALRKTFPGTAFVGTVPAIKKATSLTQKHAIGLLATNRTIYDPYTTDLSTKFAADCRIIGRGDPELVAFIEHNYLFASEEEKLKAIKPAINYFCDCGADVVVLACTHFLNMVSYFNEYAATLGMTIVDSREGVTKRALDVERNIAAITGAKKSRSWITPFNNPQDVISQEVLDNLNEQSAIKRLKESLGESTQDNFAQNAPAEKVPTLDDKDGEKQKAQGALSEGATTQSDNVSKLYITSESIDEKWRAAYEGFCHENGMIFAGVL